MSDLFGGVDVTKDIPSNPFGLEDRLYPLQILGIEEPKLMDWKTPTFGANIHWKNLDPEFASEDEIGSGGFGLFFRLPGGPDWDPIESPKTKEGKQVLFYLNELCLALGFGVDELPGLKYTDLIGRTCFGKIRVYEDSNGYTRYNVNKFARKNEKGSKIDDVADAFEIEGGGSTMDDVSRALEDAQ